MNPIKKEYIYVAYILLIILMSILPYVFAKTDKGVYALGGALIGVILSLILWITWGSENSY